MGVFLLVLKWVGLGALGITALLLLFLLIPAALRVRYADGTFSLRLRVLFFSVGILPKKPKRKKGDAEPEDAGKKRKEGVRKRPEIDFTLIRALIPPAKSLFGRLLRRIRIRNVSLRLSVRGADAAETGRAAGHIWSAAGALMPLLNSLFRISWKEFSVLPDFQNEGGEEYFFDCSVSAVPIVLIAAGILFLFRFFIIEVKHREDRKDERHGE